jgi:hypothetical protein
MLPLSQEHRVRYLQCNKSSILILYSYSYYRRHWTSFSMSFSMNAQAIAAVAATFTKNGTYLVSQLKECTQAVVQDACASIPGFPAVISAFLVADGETPHVFAEPFKPTGRGAAPPRSTGGPCGKLVSGFKQFQSSAAGYPSASGEARGPDRQDPRPPCALGEGRRGR